MGQHFRGSELVIGLEATVCSPVTNLSIKITGWTEGTYCGYQVARDTKFDVEKTMITYMTTGILLQKLINEKNLNNYTHIVLDEV